MKMPGKRAKPVVETQMISLADIAFLIIFFFLLTSTFMRDKTQVDLPRLAETAQTESPNSVSLDRSGKIFLNGQPVADHKNLEGQLKGLLAGKTDPKECEVQFRCDRGLTYKDYHPVQVAISNAGGVIAIMHEIVK